MGWSDFGSSVAGAISPNSYDLISQIQTGYNMKMSEKQRDTQNALVDQSQKRAMKYEERMANTAHQREVADLRAAGLNPVLSANAGAATLSAPSGGYGSANYSRAEIAASSAQANLARAAAIKTMAEGKISQAGAKVADEIAKNNLIASSASAKTAINDARVSSVDAEISDSKFGRFVEGTRRVSQAFAPLVNAASGVAFASARQRAAVPTTVPVRAPVVKKYNWKDDVEGGE